MKKAFFITIAILTALVASAQRECHIINENWQFRFSHQVTAGTQRVDLPHTWNAQDALSGKHDYKRGIGNYTKKLFVKPEWQGKRLFLRFEGVNSVSNLFVNGKHVGEHRGGYGAFIHEITDKVNYGKENTLLMRVNNGEQLDVMPLVGDFNFYGGIYRNVQLLVTEKNCISPLDYASPGVYLVQERVSDKRADICARVLLSNGSEEGQTLSVKVEILDGEKTVCVKEKETNIAPGSDKHEVPVEFSIRNPRLWNGTDDPFMYRAVVTLLQGEKEIDRVEQPLGVRYFHVDSNRGFFLNGKHLPIHGVCRHQERAGVGNALRDMHHDEDVSIMREMGVNAVRLAHYPQAEYMYSLMDKEGWIVWAEIPFVGPGGYADKGFVNQEPFMENGKEQLKELIRQHYNHPSICMWGLFNELKEEGDNPIGYIKELNELAHQEDPTRPTTSASNQEGAINFLTDLIAWNKYNGWYGASTATLATWLDATHAKYPELKIGLSEYGAGGSIYHQQDSLKQSVPNSWWHPENWQTEYHIRNWEIISSRPYVWGSFVWNMFDFGAAHRTEGDRPGINDKGLVTHDRKVKKDAFYFYKANWSSEPVLYIEGRRNSERNRSVTDIKVFSNCKEVTLRINGVVAGKGQPSQLKVCTFKDVKLQTGKNIIEVSAKGEDKKTIADSCTWILR